MGVSHTAMKSKLLVLFAASTALVSTSTAVPTGWLDADSLVVRENGIPSLSWGVEFPASSLEEVVTIDFENQTIEAKTDVYMEVKVLGVAFGPSSDPFLIRASYKKGKNKNEKFKQFFEGRAPDVDPLENLATRKIYKDEVVAFAFHGAENSGPDVSPNEYDWQPELFPTVGDNRMLLLRNGDVVPSSIPAFDQDAIVSFLEPYLNSDGKTLLLGERDIIVLTELSDAYLGSEEADYQDCVLLVSFQDEKPKNEGKNDKDPK